MLSIADYFLYYVTCLVAYKMGNVLFKDNESLKSYDFIGVGAISLIVYVLLLNYHNVQYLFFQ